jgi:hypothetical protein
MSTERVTVRSDPGTSPKEVGGDHLTETLLEFPCVQELDDSRRRRLSGVSPSTRRLLQRSLALDGESGMPVASTPVVTTTRHCVPL